MPPSRCPHGRQRNYCKECGGSGICEHGRQRSKCKECGGSRQETILLEATAVEVDEDAEPDEWIPTVCNHTLSWLPGREAVSESVEQCKRKR